MTEGQVLVSGGEASENGEFLLKRLPPWMPIEESDGNFKLIDAVGRSFDRLDGDIDAVDNATAIQTAESIASIREIARLVETLPRQGESVEEYRLRVIASFQKVTSEGTLEDLFGNIATLLSIDPTDIGYTDLDTNGEILLSVPGNAIDAVAITQSQLADALKDQTAAGFSVNVQTRGTFTYISPMNYNNDNHDPSKGYDGLDSNGDPKGNGGTYAGVLS